ncbi:MAG: RlmE family RNA methyltransferase, partial [Kiloniellales bacterium]|nr:RlmE family RNA methyltransferase [Kiloniellales bacterium]
QLDDKFGFLESAKRVVDLGCAPGGWLQVVSERTSPDCRIVGLDTQEVTPIKGVSIIKGDFLHEDAPDRLKEALGGPADVVLSDMAAASTGHPKTDHLRVMALVEAAFVFAEDVLAEGGTFVAKVLQGGTEHELLHELKRRFSKVRHVKPRASRSDSAEMYLVATGFHASAVSEGDEEN